MIQLRFAMNLRFDNAGYAMRRSWSPIERCAWTLRKNSNIEAFEDPADMGSMSKCTSRTASGQRTWAAEGPSWC